MQIVLWQAARAAAFSLSVKSKHSGEATRGQHNELKNTLKFACTLHTVLDVEVRWEEISWRTSEVVLRTLW